MMFILGDFGDKRGVFAVYESWLWLIADLFLSFTLFLGGAFEG